MSLNLPVLQPERLAREAFEAQLSALNADIGVVAAYGKILPDWLLTGVPRWPDQRARVAAATLSRRVTRASRRDRRRP